MKRSRPPHNQPSDDQQLTDLIGLGAASTRKNYYPELLQKIQELEQLNQELELRVKQRTADLEQSLDVLKDTQNQLVESEKMAALGTLVAGVAHEINTPLGTSITAISLIQDGLADLQESYQQNSVTRSELEETLDTSAQALTSALKNLNQAAQLISRFKEVAVDQARTNLRRINLMAYLDEVIASLAPQYDDSHVTIELRGDKQIELEVDPNTLTQILSQLIANSVEHGFTLEQRGNILIQATRTEQGVLLTYQDNGRGIDAAVQKQIFDPFFTTKPGGGNTGLGLNIVYNLVTRQLGGSINCESSPETGICFSFHLYPGS